MSATRFLHTYVNAATITCLAAASILTLALRSMPHHSLAWVGGVSLIAALAFAAAVRLILAWRSARQAGNHLPGKLTASLTSSAAVALWGLTLGGILLSVDRPPYISARREAEYSYYNVVRAKTEYENAKTTRESYVAADEFEFSYWRCRLALEELRRIGPRFQLASFIFFIGLIASVVTVVLAPVACLRAATSGGNGQAIPATT